MGIKITCDGCGKENVNTVHAEAEGGEPAFLMQMVNGIVWQSKCVAAHDEHGDGPCEIVVACSMDCRETIDRKRAEKVRAHLSVVKP